MSTIISITNRVSTTSSSLVMCSVIYAVHSKVIETPLNPSTHCPVILRFSIAYKLMINESQSATYRTSHKVAWHKVDDESIGCYKARIDVLIDNLNISLAKMSCTDVLCDSTAQVRY